MNKIAVLIICGIVLARAVLDKHESHSRKEEERESKHHEIEGSEHDHWHSEREMELESKSSSISFSSKVKDPAAKTRDKLEFELKSEGDSPMRYKLQYSHKDVNASSILHIRVMFIALVEFAESSASHEGFDADDVEVQRIKFDRRGWAPIADPVVEPIAGGKKYTFDVHQESGLFGMRIFFADAPYLAGGWLYSPMQIKIDILINNFPFKRNDTYLALACRVMTLQDSEHEDRHDVGEERQHIGDSDASIAFGWNRTVVIDGASAQVITSQFSKVGKDGDDHVQEAYFTFDAIKPKKIEWDPSIGVGAPASDANNPSGAASGILTSLGLILCAVLAVLRC